jgi:hypothetical protein
MRASHQVSSDRARRVLDATFRPLSETVRDVVTWYEAHDYFTLPAPTGARRTAPSAG